MSRYNRCTVPTHPIDPLSKQLTILVGLTVVGFMAFGLALSFYQNILFEKRLEDLDAQNRKVDVDIEQGYHDLDYYRSDQYKDKYAKENLGLLNPDEKVLIITEKKNLVSESSEESMTHKEQREAAYLELLRQMPIIEHWKLYFLHRERIEELKRGL